ncbi:hypothetical protein RvY_11782 [Ramazzottius varieornatus]|uniref:Uncharacterized protein n=1 Tax=Ramazzottius varieornatus TaxID=947166 RepID=A0A1D1VPZ0_RAMVA|nr:hypothetical protein RvY_11782 [Ramazzottius varieornatus]
MDNNSSWLTISTVVIPLHALMLSSSTTTSTKWVDLPSSFPCQLRHRGALSLDAFLLFLIYEDHNYRTCFRVSIADLYYVNLFYVHVVSFAFTMANTWVAVSGAPLWVYRVSIR